MDGATPRSRAAGDPPPNGPDAIASPRASTPRRPAAPRDPWPERLRWASWASTAGSVGMLSTFCAIVVSPWWWAVTVASVAVTAWALCRSA